MKNILIKNSVFDLPSGDYYKSADLISGTSVKIRPLITADQKALAGGQKNDTYKVYRNILSRVIVEPTTFDLDQLLVSDATSILFAVRIMTFGPEYAYQYKCSGCGATNTVKLSLYDIPLIEAKDIEGFGEPLTITLASGDIITLGLPTLGVEKRATLLTDGLKRRKGTSFGSYDAERALVRVACLIKTLNGEEAVTNDMIEYLDNLPLSDYNKIVDLISDSDIGLDSATEQSCQSCGWESSVRLALNAEFFRPKS